jgi:hypothetical protein
MKKTVSTLVVLTLLAAAPALAQGTKPTRTAPVAPPLAPPLAPPPAIMQDVPPSVPAVSSEVRATPEMWFYEQYMKEYKNPRNAVRANAEFDFQQRSNRLATMRWFGYSNSRPRIGADPANVYPPAWASNTPLQPNRWQATGGQPYYVARPDSGYRPY